jgi:hypothetical protein
MSKRNLRFESGAAGPSNQEIAVVAYSLFEAAGKLDGHDLEHWLRAKDILSHGCSAGNESQKDAKAESRPANNDAGEKTLVARAPRNRRDHRYAQASSAR